jgi:hypothetical protein
MGCLNVATRKPADKPYLWLVRQPQGLVAATAFDLEQLERYRIGARLICTLEQPRDDKTNRRFHGLIGLVAKATGEHPKKVKFQLMVRAGCVDAAETFDGLGTVIQPTHVTDLQEDEYQDLFWRVAEIVTTEILPDVDREDLIEEINKYIGVRQ